MVRIPEGAAPDVKNKSFRATAEVMLPKGSEDGVLVTQGGLSGGWALDRVKSNPEQRDDYLKASPAPAPSGT